MPSPRRRLLLLLITTACLGSVTSCASQVPAIAVRAVQPKTVAPSIVSRATPQGLAAIPGLGHQIQERVPASSSQVVVVTGKGLNDSTSKVVIYQRDQIGWHAGPTWAAHNAVHGWTLHHRAGDLRSPMGVFTLTDAGGLKANPGTRFSYDQSPGFSISGTGFAGETLAGAFDYVLAINYNRRAGTSPLDWTRPLGAGAGGGIWFHVDHGGPTHGCIGLQRADMELLLRTLDPAQHPIAVMGDVSFLRGY